MAERMPSLELILSSFERERDRDLSHFDSLDSKAGVMLGFSGILVALVGNQQTFLLRAATALAGVAALLALSAFWPRRLPTVEVGSLRSYIAAEQSITRLVMVDTYLQMLIEPT